MEPALKIELLRQMKRIRTVEETIAERYSQWQMRCPTHLCSGQESVAAAVGLALRKTDFCVSTHRAHGHYLAKGGNLGRMLAEIYGKQTGCSAGKGGSMHLIDREAGFMGSTAIVGGTIPVGVGLGLSIALKKTDQVSCVFFGDGATEEGVFYESLNYAVLKKLPVLFICENNFYSVYTPLHKRQPKDRQIAGLVRHIGMKSEAGEGNDAVSVYNSVNRAVKEMRVKNEPRFFEFTTYRWREHCGPNYDNDIGYRRESEFLEWMKKDPIAGLESEVLNKSIMEKADLEQMQQQIDFEVEQAFSFALDSDFPDPREAFTGVFKSGE